MHRPPRSEPRPPRPAAGRSAQAPSDRELDTEKVHGLNAALAVFAVRPDAIVRIAHSREVRRDLGDVLRYAASKRIPYNEVDDEELARIAGTVHHEGISLVTRRRETLALTELVRLLRRGNAGGAAIAMDQLGNPHNLGAVIRSAAYFGVEAVLLGEETGQVQLTPAAVRVAEGGVERIAIARVPDLAGALAALRRERVRVIGTDARARVSIFEAKWPRPCVLVLGNERSGMSPGVREQCDELVAIPGSGAVESLNVSVAAGVVLAELARGRGKAEGKASPGNLHR